MYAVTNLHIQTSKLKQRGDRRVKLSQLAGATLILNVAGPQPVLAAEWRFCIAPSSQELKVYVTAPFLAGTPMESMEKAFHQLLYRSGLRHDSVQCPSGTDEQAVRSMRQYVREFNRQRGNEVVPVDWESATTR
jgi:hypothetical protein